MHLELNVLQPMPKVAFIAGYGVGISAAFAKQAGSGGYELALLARNKPRLDAAVQGMRFIHYAAGSSTRVRPDYCISEDVQLHGSLYCIAVMFTCMAHILHSNVHLQTCVTAIICSSCMLHGSRAVTRSYSPSTHTQLMLH